VGHELGARGSTNLATLGASELARAVLDRAS